MMHSATKALLSPVLENYHLVKQTHSFAVRIQVQLHNVPQHETIVVGENHKTQTSTTFTDKRNRSLEWH